VRLLVVGSGGREHALCWALHRENPGAAIYCAPGNPGTSEVANNLPIPADDLDRLADAADAWGIDLVIIGPEVPLALGLADRLRAEGRMVVGPGAAAAQVEASKAFSKEIMEAAGIPTATSRTFTDLALALAWVDQHPEPLVVKASGLAAGKGAIVCATREEARAAVQGMLGEGTLGDAGRTVVIEQFLEGEEVSVMALTNGTDVTLLPAAQDHKRLGDGDQGPNTGGMGAYAPVSIATPALLDRTRKEVLLPCLAELRKRGTPFSGVLYAGLMVDSAGAPWVVEFNCRLGDPETEVVLPLVGGLTSAFEAIAKGDAPPALVTPGGLFAVTTVLASEGYPGTPRKGQEIRLPQKPPEGVMIFHAGTTRDEKGTLRVSGGRVFAVTGVGRSFEDAQARSRAGAESIQFEGKVYRHDIGWREAARRRG